MAKLSAGIQKFFSDQGFVIVSTVDKGGTIHCAAKGIVGIEAERIFLVDLYLAHTYANILVNPAVSVTAVDGHKFQGYTLKGKARVVEREKIAGHLMQAWEDRVIQRISQRMVRNIQEKRSGSHHPESKFPQPKYLLEIDVESIIDLAPAHLKQGNV